MWQGLGATEYGEATGKGSEEHYIIIIIIIIIIVIIIIIIIIGKVKTFTLKSLPGSARSSLNYKLRLTSIVLKIKFVPRSKHSPSQLQQDR